MPMPLIKHIVVLMLENRSFDHMVGYMQSSTYPIDGIDAAHPPTNPMSPNDSTPVAATPDAPDVLSFDAGHSVPDTNLQLYLRVEGPPPSGATNMGFVYSYSQQQGVTPATAPLIMKCFPPNRVPVLTTLAREFALCTRWYSSVPGPTWPNRFFVHCATSKGFIDNSLLHNYDMRTIFENLSSVNSGTWKIYSHDFPQAQVLNGINIPAFDQNWDSIGGFKDDAANNVLPNYSFIEPKYTTFLGEANDQHPPHSIHAGEQLIAEVYDAVRNSAGLERDAVHPALRRAWRVVRSSIASCGDAARWSDVAILVRSVRAARPRHLDFAVYQEWNDRRHGVRPFVDSSDGEEDIWSAELPDEARCRRQHLRARVESGDAADRCAHQSDRTGRDALRRDPGRVG